MQRRNNFSFILFSHLLILMSGCDAKTSKAWTDNAATKITCSQKNDSVFIENDNQTHEENLKVLLNSAGVTNFSIDKNRPNYLTKWNVIDGVLIERIPSQAFILSLKTQEGTVSIIKVDGECLSMIEKIVPQGSKIFRF